MIKHEDIKISLYYTTLPESIHGATEKTGENSFIIALNANDTEGQNYISFLHEMTHIYKKHFTRATTSDIEHETEELIKTALETLRSK